MVLGTYFINQLWIYVKMEQKSKDYLQSSDIEKKKLNNRARKFNTPEDIIVIIKLTSCFIV